MLAGFRSLPRTVVGALVLFLALLPMLAYHRDRLPSQISWIPNSANYAASLARDAHTAITHASSTELSNDLEPLPFVAQEAEPELTPSADIVRLNADGRWPISGPGAPPARYMSYLPHSGISNQRISLVNALVLSKLLNRTLVVPPVTLGSGVDWHEPVQLQSDLDFTEDLEVTKCSQMHWTIRKVACGKYWKSIRASWSWLLDAEAVRRTFDVVDRPTHSRAWYKDALGLSDDQIKSFPDPERRSYRFYDNSDSTAPLQEQASSIPYGRRLNVDALRKFDDYPLLEFGSLFGRTRLLLELPESLQLLATAEALMAFKQPVLERVSNAMALRLGGHSTYAGVHLRVGGAETSAMFHDGIQERMASVFRTLCTALKLDGKYVDEMLRTNRRQADNETFVPEPLKFASISTAFRPSINTRCPYQLYDNSSPLAPLNTPIYIATDSRQPRKDPALDVFLNSFPCLFVLNDFRRPPKAKPNPHFDQEPVPELHHLMDDVVDQKGDKLGEFLVPYVEAETIAKGKLVVGTPSSTFSVFARTVLFNAYHSHPSN